MKVFFALCRQISQKEVSALEVKFIRKLPCGGGEVCGAFSTVVGRMLRWARDLNEMVLARQAANRGKDKIRRA